MAMIRQELKTELRQVIEQKELAPEFYYHLLRYALEVYSKNVSQLNSGEYDNVYHKAIKSFELESSVLTAPEAQGIIITEQQVEESLAIVASRYESNMDFMEDLNKNSLTESSLRKALYRELLFDAIMQRVLADTPEVSDVDIQLFYEMHRDRFDTPETRVASHILITINPDYPENTPEAALRIIQDIAEKLNNRSNRFMDFAKRFSECPTAMEGGKLGEIVRGQLYPELDSMLFAMNENDISPIVETEMGYHIMLCEKIKKAKSVPLSKVSDKIREILTARHVHNHQKNWLANLKHKD